MAYHVVVLVKQVPDTKRITGEAMRDDEHFSNVAAWEFNGVGSEPEVHKEQLEFEYAHPSTRSYK